MDLLKDIAKEHLVHHVMANSQKTLLPLVSYRVKSSILSDSDPYDPTRNQTKATFSSRRRMSFMTARNLLKRTYLLNYCRFYQGIGIALILALSNGVSDCVKKVQKTPSSLFHDKLEAEPKQSASPDLSDKPYKDNNLSSVSCGVDEFVKTNRKTTSRLSRLNGRTRIEV